MNYQLAVPLIYPDAEFNPACFDFTEEEARKKKLWRDARPMPTSEEMTVVLDAHKVEEDEKNALAILLKEKKDALKLKIKDKSAKLEDVVAILEILLDE